MANVTRAHEERLPATRLRPRERELLAQLYPTLRRFAAVVGPIEMDPDDLVQDAVVGALGRRRLDDYTDLGAYLRRSIVSLAANERRRFGRRRRALSRMAPAADGQVASYPSDLADLVGLAPDARAVLYLAEVEGWSYLEIATLLGTTEDAARTRASRARAQLRRQLTADLGGVM
jgi:DNA-directed RNA polymerase specialized sigma24 family protein